MTNTQQAVTVYISEANFTQLFHLIADALNNNHLALNIDSNFVRSNLANDISHHIEIENALDNNESASFAIKYIAKRSISPLTTNFEQWFANHLNVSVVTESTSEQVNSANNQALLTQLINDVAQNFANELQNPTVMKRLTEALAQFYSDDPQALASAQERLAQYQDRNWYGRTHVFDNQGLTQEQSTGIVSHFIASEITGEQTEFHQWLTQILSDQGTDFAQALSTLRQEHLLTDDNLGFISQSFTHETGLSAMGEFFNALTNNIQGRYVLNSANSDATIAVIIDANGHTVMSAADGILEIDEAVGVIEHLQDLILSPSGQYASLLSELTITQISGLTDTGAPNWSLELASADSALIDSLVLDKDSLALPINMDYRLSLSGDGKLTITLIDTVNSDIEATIVFDDLNLDNGPITLQEQPQWDDLYSFFYEYTSNVALMPVTSYLRDNQLKAADEHNRIVSIELADQLGSELARSINQTNALEHLVSTIQLDSAGYLNYDAKVFTLLNTDGSVLADAFGNKVHFTFKQIDPITYAKQGNSDNTLTIKTLGSQGQTVFSILEFQVTDSSGRAIIALNNIDSLIAEQYNAISAAIDNSDVVVSPMGGDTTAFLHLHSSPDGSTRVTVDDNGYASLINRETLATDYPELAQIDSNYQPLVFSTSDQNQPIEIDVSSPQATDDYQPLNPTNDYQPLNPTDDYQPLNPTNDYQPLNPNSNNNNTANYIDNLFAHVSSTLNDGAYNLKDNYDRLTALGINVLNAENALRDTIDAAVGTNASRTQLKLTAFEKLMTVSSIAEAVGAGNCSEHVAIAVKQMISDKQTGFAIFNIMDTNYEGSDGKSRGSHVFIVGGLTQAPNQYQQFTSWENFDFGLNPGAYVIDPWVGTSYSLTADNWKETFAEIYNRGFADNGLETRPIQETSSFSIDVSLYVDPNGITDSASFGFEQSTIFKSGVTLSPGDIDTILQTDVHSSDRIKMGRYGTLGVFFQSDLITQVQSQQHLMTLFNDINSTDQGRSLLQALKNSDKKLIVSIADTTIFFNNYTDVNGVAYDNVAHLVINQASLANDQNAAANRLLMAVSSLTGTTVDTANFNAEFTSTPVTEHSVSTVETVTTLQVHNAGTDLASGGIWSVAELKTNAHVTLKPIGESYQAIIDKLTQLHATSPAGYDAVSGQLISLIDGYLQTHGSGRNKALALLKDQVTQSLEAPVLYDLSNNPNSNNSNNNYDTLVPDTTDSATTVYDTLEPGETDTTTAYDTLEPGNTADTTTDPYVTYNPYETLESEGSDGESTPTDTTPAPLNPTEQLNQLLERVGAQATALNRDIISSGQISLQLNGQGSIINLSVESSLSVAQKVRLVDHAKNLLSQLSDYELGSLTREQINISTAAFSPTTQVGISDDGQLNIVLGSDFFSEPDPARQSLQGIMATNGHFTHQNASLLSIIGSDLTAQLNNSAMTSAEIGKAGEFFARNIIDVGAQKFGAQHPDFLTHTSTQQLQLVLNDINTPYHYALASGQEVTLKRGDIVIKIAPPADLPLKDKLNLLEQGKTLLGQLDGLDFGENKRSAIILTTALGAPESSMHITSDNALAITLSNNFFDTPTQDVDLFSHLALTGNNSTRQNALLLASIGRDTASANSNDPLSAHDLQLASEYFARQVLDLSPETFAATNRDFRNTDIVKYISIMTALQDYKKAPADTAHTALENLINLTERYLQAYPAQGATNNILRVQGSAKEAYLNLTGDAYQSRAEQRSNVELLQNQATSLYNNAKSVDGDANVRLSSLSGVLSQTTEINLTQSDVIKAYIHAYAIDDGAGVSAFISNLNQVNAIFKRQSQGIASDADIATANRFIAAVLEASHSNTVQSSAMRAQGSTNAIRDVLINLDDGQFSIELNAKDQKYVLYVDTFSQDYRLYNPMLGEVTGTGSFFNADALLAKQFGIGAVFDYVVTDHTITIDNRDTNSFVTELTQAVISQRTALINQVGETQAFDGLRLVDLYDMGVMIDGDRLSSSQIASTDNWRSLLDSNRISFDANSFMNLSYNKGFAQNLDLLGALKQLNSENPTALFSGNDNVKAQVTSRFNGLEEFDRLSQSTEQAIRNGHNLPSTTLVPDGVSQTTSISQAISKIANRVENSPVNQSISKGVERFSALLFAITTPSSIFSINASFAQGKNLQAGRDLGGLLADITDYALDSLDNLFNAASTLVSSAKFGSLLSKVGNAIGRWGGALGGVIAAPFAIWSAVDSFKAAANTALSKNERIDAAVSGSLATAGAIVGLTFGVTALVALAGTAAISTGLIAGAGAAAGIFATAGAITSAAGPVGAVIGAALAIAGVVYTAVRVGEQLRSQGVSLGNRVEAGLSIAFGFGMPDGAEKESLLKQFELSAQNNATEYLSQLTANNVDRYVYSNAVPTYDSDFYLQENGSIMGDGANAYVDSEGLVRVYTYNGKTYQYNLNVEREVNDAGQFLPHEDDVKLTKIGSGYYSGTDLIVGVSGVKDEAELSDDEILRIASGGAYNINTASVVKYTGPGRLLVNDANETYNSSSQADFGSYGVEEQNLTLATGDIASTFFSLGGGDDTIVGDNDKRNIVMVSEGDKQYTGANLADTFNFLSVDLTGVISGGHDVNDNDDLASFASINWAVDVDLASGNVDLVSKVLNNFTLHNIEHVTGTQHSDIIKGNEANNVISGNGGNDKLYGRAGNDVLVASAGDAYLEGGLGIDTYIVGNYHSDASQHVIINNAISRDAFLADRQGEQDILALSATGVTFSQDGYALVLTSGDDNTTVRINGYYEYADVYNPSNDTLAQYRADYGYSSDINYIASEERRHLNLQDGFGNFYVLNHGANEQGAFESPTVSTIILNSSETISNTDIDLNDASLSQVDTNGSEKTGQLLTETLVNVIGAASDDTITGNAQDNYLSGGAGVDIIEGGAGDDLLSAGLNGGHLTGGDGQDAYIVQQGHGTVVIHNNGQLTDADTQDGDILQLSNTAGDALLNIDEISLRIIGDNVIVSLDSAADTAPTQVTLTSFVRNSARQDNLVIQLAQGNFTITADSDQARFKAVSLSLDLSLAQWQAVMASDSPTGLSAEQQRVYQLYQMLDTTENEVISVTLNNATITSQYSNGQWYSKALSSHAHQTTINLSANTLDGQATDLSTIEYVVGSNGNDVIIGSDRNDFIQGHYGNDTITLGNGDDVISGNEGSDTYRIGSDITGVKIIDNSDAAGALDTLVFDGATSFYFERSGDSLVIVQGQGDTLLEQQAIVLINDWFVSEQNQHINIIAGASNTTYTSDYINQKLAFDATLLSNNVDAHYSDTAYNVYANSGELSFNSGQYRVTAITVKDLALTQVTLSSAQDTLRFSDNGVLDASVANLAQMTTPLTISFTDSVLSIGYSQADGYAIDYVGASPDLSTLSVNELLNHLANTTDLSSALLSAQVRYLGAQNQSIALSNANVRFDANGTLAQITSSSDADTLTEVAVAIDALALSYSDASAFSLITPLGQFNLQRTASTLALESVTDAQARSISLDLDSAQFNALMYLNEPTLSQQLVSQYVHALGELAPNNTRITLTDAQISVAMVNDALAITYHELSVDKPSAITANTLSFDGDTLYMEHDYNIERLAISDDFVLSVARGNNHISVGSGNHRVTGGQDDDVIYLYSDGNDEVFAAQGQDKVVLTTTSSGLKRIHFTGTNSEPDTLELTKAALGELVYSVDGNDLHVISKDTQATAVLVDWMLLDDKSAINISNGKRQISGDDVAQRVMDILMDQTLLVEANSGRFDVNQSLTGAIATTFDLRAYDFSELSIFMSNGQLIASSSSNDFSVRIHVGDTPLSSFSFLTQIGTLTLTDEQYIYQGFGSVMRYQSTQLTLDVSLDDLTRVANYSYRGRGDTSSDPRLSAIDSIITSIDSPVFLIETNDGMVTFNSELREVALVPVIDPNLVIEEDIIIDNREIITLTDELDKIDDNNDSTIYFGLAGNDLFKTRTGGDDKFVGGQGFDRYQLRFRSSGEKSVDNYATDGKTDTLRVWSNDVRYSLDGNDLIITQLNSDGSDYVSGATARILNWLIGDAYQHLVVKTRSGEYSTDDINLLIQEMSSFEDSASNSATIETEQLVSTPTNALNLIS